MVTNTHAVKAESTRKLAKTLWVLGGVSCPFVLECQVCCVRKKRRSAETQHPTRIISSPVDCRAEYSTTVTLNEVAAQPAIAWVLLTEETSLRKLLILANLREEEKKTRVRQRSMRVVCDAGRLLERGKGSDAGSAHFPRQRRIFFER